MNLMVCFQSLRQFPQDDAVHEGLDPIPHAAYQWHDLQSLEGLNPLVLEIKCLTDSSSGLSAFCQTCELNLNFPFVYTLHLNFASPVIAECSASSRKQEEYVEGSEECVVFGKEITMLLSV